MGSFESDKGLQLLTEIRRNVEISKRKFSLEQPSISDAEEIVKLVRSSWLDAYPSEKHGVTSELIEEYFEKFLTEESIERFQLGLAAPLEGVTRVVLRHQGKIVGYCKVVRGESQNELRSLYVHPEFTGAGLGTALWEEASRFIDTSKDTVLTTVSYSQAALFYTKLGFTEVEQYTDGEFRFSDGTYIPLVSMVLKGDQAL